MKRLIAAAGLTGILALGGCNHHAGPIAGQPDAIPAGDYPTITVEAGLSQYLVVDYGAITAEPSTDAFPLEVMVPVRSTANTQMLIQYQYSWFDGQDRLLSESGWRFAEVPAGLRRQLQGNARSNEAYGWRLEIRSAR